MGSKASVIQIQGTGNLQVCFQGYGQYGWAVYAGGMQVISLGDQQVSIPFGEVPSGAFSAGKPFVMNVPNTYPQMTIVY